MTRSYSEMRKLTSFVDRYNYLRLSGHLGENTFGFDRYLNQYLYKSKRWKRTRELVIVRDNGCDLGIDDRPIRDRVIVHHMNPITEEDIELERNYIFDPEFLICSSERTHKAIHYSDESLLQVVTLVVRKHGDTSPWINARQRRE